MLLTRRNEGLESVLREVLDVSSRKNTRGQEISKKRERR